MDPARVVVVAMGPARSEGPAIVIQLDAERRLLLAGARSIPAREVEVVDVDHEDFADFPHVFRIRRAVIAHENGWSLSVIWGSGTYSDNHDAWTADDEFREEPDKVEVAVFPPEATASMEVLGYLDETDLVSLVDYVGTLPSRTVSFVIEWKAETP